MEISRQSEGTRTRILVVGASGYIGSRLVPQLLVQGYRVSCLIRDRNKITAYPWSDSVEVFKGDVLDANSLDRAFQQVSVVYYLAHSMSNPTADFAELDRKAALNVGTVAKRFGVKRLIYLGARDTGMENSLPT